MLPQLLLVHTLSLYRGTFKREEGPDTVTQAQRPESRSPSGHMRQIQRWRSCLSSLPWLVNSGRPCRPPDAASFLPWCTLAGSAPSVAPPHCDTRSPGEQLLPQRRSRSVSPGEWWEEVELTHVSPSRGCRLPFPGAAAGAGLASHFTGQSLSHVAGWWGHSEFRARGPGVALGSLA